MKRIVMVVRDRAADTFGQPFFVVSVGVGVRSFSDAINNPSEDSDLRKHPEDFDLFKLGTFDDDTAVFEVGLPEQVALGRDLVARKEE